MIRNLIFKFKMEYLVAKINKVFDKIFHFKNYVGKQVFNGKKI